MKKLASHSASFEDREYRPLEMIKDNYPKYVLTTDVLKQRRNGIIHEYICGFISKGKAFLKGRYVSHHRAG